jgi:hypothetical protein
MPLFPLPAPTTQAQLEGVALSCARANDGTRIVNLAAWPIAVVVDRRSRNTPRNYKLDVSRYPVISCNCGKCSSWGSYENIKTFPYRGERCENQWAVLYAKYGVPIDAPILDNWGMPYDSNEPKKSELRQEVAEAVRRHGAQVVLDSGMSPVSGGYQRLRDRYGESLYHEAADFYDIAWRLKEMFPSAVRERDARGNFGMTQGEHLFTGLMYVYHTKSMTWASGWCNEFLAKRVGDYRDLRAPKPSACGEWLRSVKTTAFLDDVLMLTAQPMSAIGGMSTLTGDATGKGVNRFFDWINDRRPRSEGKPGKPGARELVARGDGTRSVRPYWSVLAISCAETLATVAVDVAVGPAGESPRAEQLLRRVFPQFEAGHFLGDSAYQDPIRKVCLEFGWTPTTPFRRHTVGGTDPDIFRRCFLRFADNPRKYKDLYTDRYKAENEFSVVKGIFGQFVRCTHGAGPANEIRLKFICNNIRMLEKAVRVYRTDLPFFDRSVNEAA